MAISADQDILNILKRWYKDGVENLLRRKSSALREIDIVRVEGKEQSFSAITGSCACSANALVAKEKAAENASTAEYVVTPGEAYSVFTFNNKEVQASLSKKGAYMKVAGLKSFAGAEALRRTLAVAFYGRGYGELAILGAANAAIVAAASAGASITLTLPRSVIMALSEKVDLVIKSSVTSATEIAILTVSAINGNNVTFVIDTAYAGASATDVLALRGSIDENGNPALPVGLAGWLPVVGLRTGTDWTNYINTTFYNVNRASNVEAKAGSFTYDATNTSFKADIQDAMWKSRQMGGEADFIIMNPADFLKVDNELSASNTYFTSTSTRSKKDASIGFHKLASSFSTNYIDLIYDDSFCPEGMFYVLEKENIEFWAYTNSEVAFREGIDGNNPGKQDPEEFENKGHENDSYKLLIDDILTVEPGEYTRHAASVRCTYNILGTFVVLAPGNMTVGIFHDADTASLVAVAA